MSNVIRFNGDMVYSGGKKIEDLVKSLFGDKMDRSFLVSMNQEGEIRINLSGEFYASEILYALEILKNNIMKESEYHE